MDRFEHVPKPNPRMCATWVPGATGATWSGFIYVQLQAPVAAMSPTSGVIRTAPGEWPLG